MSAICGVVNAVSGSAGSAQLRPMLERMAHRGPDGMRLWASDATDAAIGQADLHAFANDRAALGRGFLDTEDAVVVIDGAVTNRRELGHGCDAAAALAAYREKGKEGAGMLDGPFAMAVFDKGTRSLLLTRDKLGERSLYYHVDDSARTLVFASEIKALLAHPAVPLELDTETLSIYLAFGYVPGAGTLFKGIRKLLPGESLCFAPGAAAETAKYWRLPHIGDGPHDEPYCIEHLGELFMQAMERYTDGAERVGVFLSGGVDSSIIVAALRELGVPHVGTFTVGFTADPTATKDTDLHYARMIADRYGTEHHEVVLGPDHDPRDGLLDVIRQVDDLVMTPNSYSKYVLASAAREAGYNSILTGSAAAGACGVHRKFLNPKKREKLLRKTRECATDEERFYALRGRLFDLDTQRRLLVQAPSVTDADILAVLREYVQYIESDDFFRLFLFSNLAVTSAEKTLRVLENVGAMASVDIRSPYLDRALVEFSTELPSSFDGGQSYVTLKTHLKKAFEDKLPREVLERRVIGYPSYYWNNGEIAAYQSSVLGREHMERTGLFNHEAVHRLLEEEKTEEKKSAGKYAWALTQFALWYDERFSPEPLLAVSG